jgi:hypothetical protein
MSFPHFGDDRCKDNRFWNSSISPSSGQTPDAGLQSPAGFGACRRLAETRHSDKARARIALMAANFTETQSFERDQLFELLDDLSERIKAVIEQWLEKKAAGDAKVRAAFDAQRHRIT